MLLIGSLLILSGCQSDGKKWDDIPLVSSGMPYQIPPGVYTDVDGVCHEETVVKWVLSEADLYDFIQYLKMKANGQQIKALAVTTNDLPYKLSAGIYIDTDGRFRKEDGEKYLIAEGDLDDFFEYLQFEKDLINSIREQKQ